MKKVIWLAVSCSIVATLLLLSCGPAVTEEEEVAPPAEEEETMPEEEETMPEEEETMPEEEETMPEEEEIVPEEEETVPEEEEIVPEEEETVPEEEETVPEEEETVPEEEETVPTGQGDTIGFSPYGYDLLFTHGNLNDIEIVITQEEWDSHIKDMRNYASTDKSGKGLTGNYRKALFIYKGPAGDAIIEEVGFRTKGHYTRPVPEDYSGLFHRAHFKVKFDKVFDQEEGTDEYEARKDRRFCRLRALELRLNLQDIRWDNSQIRELYCYDLMNRAGVYTSKTGSARLTITVGGQEHYFGIYTIIEPIDKSFLTKRFSKARNDGNLYKCLWGDSGPATLEPIDEKFTANQIFPEERAIGVKDWTTHYRPTYDLKTNEDVAAHTELLDFINSINTLSGAELKDYLDANFEVDRFLRHQAMNVLIGKWDDYWAMGNNYYLYFNNDGKIEFLPNDYDMALGGGFMLFDTASVGIYEWGNRCRQFLKLVAPQIPKSWLGDYHSPLVEKTLEIDEYRARYEHYLKEFINPSNKLFVYSEYERKFNMMYELYSPYLDNDIDEGEEMINDESTREYFRKRTKSIIEQLGLDEEDYEIPPPTGQAATFHADSVLSPVWVSTDPRERTNLK